MFLDDFSGLQTEKDRKLRVTNWNCAQENLSLSYKDKARVRQYTVSQEQSIYGYQ